MKVICIALLFVSVALCMTYVKGPIFDPVDWTIMASPYVLTGDVVVHPGATLSIGAGVTVQFNKNTRIHVRGYLVTGVNYTKNKMDTIFTSSEECNAERSRKLPIYPGWVDYYNWINMASKGLDVYVMSGSSNFVNNTFSITGDLSCSVNYERCNAPVVYNELLEEYERNFINTTGYTQFPNAFNWTWTKREFGGYQFSVSIKFKNESDSYCGSIYSDGDVAYPQIHVNHTQFIGMQAVIENFSNITDLNSLKVSDCLMGFSFYRNNGWFYLNCTNCTFKNVSKFFPDEYSQGNITFHDSFFSNSIITVPRYVKLTFNQTFFTENTTLTTRNDVQIFDCIFENSTLRSEDGRLVLHNSHFEEAYVALVFRGSQRTEVINCTFIQNQIGLAIVEDFYNNNFDFIINNLHSVNPRQAKRALDTQALMDGDFNLVGNDISKNLIGVYVSDPVRDLKITKNNIYHNKRFNLVNYRRSALDATNNYWGENLTANIQKTIWDARREGSMGLVTFSPFVTRKINSK